MTVPLSKLANKVNVAESVTPMGASVASLPARASLAVSAFKTKVCRSACGEVSESRSRNHGTSPTSTPVANATAPSIAHSIAQLKLTRRVRSFERETVGNGKLCVGRAAAFWAAGGFGAGRAARRALVWWWVTATEGTSVLPAVAMSGTERVDSGTLLMTSTPET
jgi:hypothetical protein